MEPYIEIAKVILAAILGGLGGYLVKRWDVAQQARMAANDRWAAERQSHWSPLLRAARELQQRFAFLRDIYQRKPNMPFSPESLSADFRELYVLSRAAIPNLQDADPNAPRRDQSAVQNVRARVCHELTFAESSVYKTVAYLGHAEHVLRDLEDDRLDTSADARDELSRLVRGVRASLQGATGAGIFQEQQEYIGQMVWSPAGHVISNLELRQQLLNLPGWENYKNVLRFFADFGPKVDYEVTSTIESLERLAGRLDRLRASRTKRDYRPSILPAVAPSPETASPARAG